MHDDIRIGANRFGRLPADLEHAARIDFRDARRQAAVVVLALHPDRPLGRVDVDVVQVPLHVFHPPAACGLRGAAEQQGLPVGRLGPGGDGRVLREETMAGLDEGSAGGRIDAGEVRRDHHLPLCHVALHLRHLRLAGGQAGDRRPPAIAVATGDGAIQLGGAGAHHGGEDHVGARLVDALDGALHVVVGGIQRNVDFLEHRAAVLAVQVAHHMVAFPRIDVVRADEHHPLAVVANQVRRQRRTVLVRRRTAVDDVRRILEALVGGRVAEQRVGALDHRHHRLARVRHVAAHEEPYPPVANEVLGAQPIAVRVAARVLGQRFDRATADAALAVQLLDRKQCAIALRALDIGGDAGFGEQQADQRPLLVRSHPFPLL